MPDKFHFALEPGMPQSVSENILMLIGELKAGVEGMKEDIARVDDAVRENSRCWHAIAVEQGAARAATEKLSQRVDTMNGQIDEVNKSLKPLVDWQRTGVRVLAWLTAAGGVAAVLFGPTLARLGESILTFVKGLLP